ncbi:dihydropteroate synthase [Saccharopolyspora kobensis]|uniref:Dihydropteroate synthase n=1 Tax=Saccharopolyspora kobensis TaxID=146035 RepID=A0A1H6A011_9PSEU|nr:dihydropteroate synthase [Saccharopolyspora kobensis]SEG41781.1 dihydropteroate synthase [Saccharopolyspora kobensis]SFE16829.1 dihydropteroate synthase [Saccharopolyspora kobensis]
MTEPQRTNTGLADPESGAAAGRLLRMLRGPRRLVCGILNVTPDSFSDGGAHRDGDAAVRHGIRLIEEGADILDIGGESTRPGSHPPSAAEELDRVVPVVERLAHISDTPLSVDTSRPEVMRAAVAAGATLINDVRALRYPGAVGTAVELGVPVCLSHMLRPPHLMQDDPNYRDVLAEVADFLRERIETCVSAGIPRERLVVDPGFGFGKTLEHNLALLRSLGAFAELAPVMAGLSRKAMLGQITGRPVEQREAASVTAAVLAAQRGAKVLRVHDVAATVDALGVLAATEEW